MIYWPFLILTQNQKDAKTGKRLQELEGPTCLLHTDSIAGDEIKCVFSIIYLSFSLIPKGINVHISTVPLKIMRNNEKFVDGAYDVEIKPDAIDTSKRKATHDKN